MRALFANIPFIKRGSNGELRTGPNAGSRWPWTQVGITEYAPFPFFMAYAVSYLRSHGVQAGFYDGVVERHWDYRLVRRAIAAARPEVLFLETATPLYRTICETALWARRELGCRIVLTGPHVQAFAEELVREPWVDHCVIGEYERAALRIAIDGNRAPRLLPFDPADVNRVNGDNFVPYRPLAHLYGYWDPSMATPRPQLTVATSRGCPFKCTYCQWPKVMNQGRFRQRMPELVIDEIRAVIADFRREQARPASFVRAAVAELGVLARGQESIARARRGLRDRRVAEIGSIFFDDDTWNLGAARIRALCRGLKDIGLPWTMMGRIDTSDPPLYDLMVSSGCVGMRFGIESFDQQLLDNTKKKLDASTSHRNVRYLLTRFSGLEFHFTTMKNLPGETAADWERDLRILEELKELGERSGNTVHWQNSVCVAFPGTELWEEMVARGKGEELRNFDLYDGNPDNDARLAQSAGWLGQDYRPEWAEYSGDGQPTDLPNT